MYCRLHLQLRPTLTTDRAPRRACRASAASQDTSIADERRNSALEFQLRRSAERQPAAPQEDPSADILRAGHDKDLAERKLAARAWITPWLDTKTRGESRKVLKEMQKRVAMMEGTRSDSAMRRQLNKGKHVSEEEIAAQAAADSQVANEQEQSDAKYAPTKSYEDGSMLFTASTLEGAGAPGS